MSQESLGRVGDYEILSVLGEGGMGKVFKVRNVISDRIEAMKVLLPDLAGRQEMAERFLREIKLLAALEHPNIAVLRTALTLDNRLVMVMEYVEGSTLAARLNQGPIPLPDVLNYVDQVLAALGYAHQHHVIHRDIKPANMMLTPEGVVKLMDFGIARSGTDRGLTATGTTLGSLYYMSPEQVKGQPTNERSDLYSVGVSLFEMVTGKKPFEGNSDFSIMNAHLQEAPTIPPEVQASMPPAVLDLLLMALAKDPADRFHSAEAFRLALKSVRAGLAPESQPAVRPSVPVVPAPVTAAAAAPVRTPAPASPLGAPAFPGAMAPAPAPMPTVVQAMPAAAAPLPPSVTPKSHRGLYMALGALLVVAVLVAAGLYLPRWKSSRAASPAAQSLPSPAESPVVADAGVSAPAANVPPTVPPTPATGPAGVSVATGAAKSPSSLPPAARIAPSGDTRQASHAAPALASSAPTDNRPSTPAATVAAPPAEAAPNAELLGELETKHDHLASRAAAVSASLNSLSRAQAAQGLGLRGDIVAAQQRMQTALSRADSALQRQDAKSAEKYLESAEAEVRTLEKFLGR